MLEKISLALQTYASVYTGAARMFEEVKKELDANYKGALYASKLGESKEIYESTLTSSREENYSVCVDVLEGVKKQIQAVASEPIEDDFNATLAALKVIKNPTKTEIQAIIGRYRNNYLAYRAICDLFDKELCATITIDDVLDACDELSDMLHRCFYGGEGIEGYFYQLMLQGDYIGKYDELFRSFITRDFDIVDMQLEKQFDTQSEEGDLK